MLGAVQPILFHIPWSSGPVPYGAYGFFLAVSFILGILLSTREGRKQGLSSDRVVQACFVCLVTSLLGSRLLHLVMAEPQAFFANPGLLFDFTRGGFAFYGGFILGMFAMLVYCRLRGIEYLQMADVLVAQGGLGLAFGRTGCLLAGCCHGRPVEAPLPSWLLNVVPLKWPEWFSLTFPSEAEGLGSLLDQPLVPTQPLSGLYSLAIFLFIALWLVPRKRYHGQVVVWFLMMYAVARATIELFRGDARGMYFGEALSTSQIVSVPVFLAGLAILLWARSRMASGKLSPLSATWREDALAAALKPAGVEPRKGGTVRKNKKKKRRR
jgi:phosphatidylglycerol---prolipoprotein diacylglyceryl transferase